MNMFYAIIQSKNTLYICKGNEKENSRGIRLWHTKW